MTDDELAVTCVYPLGQPTDFTVKYVDYLKQTIKEGRAFEIATENLGHLFNLRTCSFFLASYFANDPELAYVPITKNLVERCYNILSYILRRANYSEMLDDDRLAVGYESPDAKEIHIGVFEESRKQLLHDLFCNRNITIRCYDLSMRGKEKAIRHCLETFLLDNASYKEFLDFWRNVPNHEDVRKILAHFFPQDIISKIITMIK